MTLRKGSPKRDKSMFVFLFTLDISFFSCNIIMQIEETQTNI